jgi:hypothetical protein
MPNPSSSNRNKRLKYLGLGVLFLAVVCASVYAYFAFIKESPSKSTSPSTRSETDPEDSNPKTHNTPPVHGPLRQKGTSNCLQYEFIQDTSKVTLFMADCQGSSASWYYRGWGGPYGFLVLGDGSERSLSYNPNTLGFSTIPEGSDPVEFMGWSNSEGVISHHSSGGCLNAGYGDNGQDVVVGQCGGTEWEHIPSAV